MDQALINPPKFAPTVNDLDKRFLRRANEIAYQSDDPKAKLNVRSAVGAVIVRDGAILAESANRLPNAIRKKFRITDPNDRDRYHFIEHAERSAIYKATRALISLDNATIYCTRFACSDCARAIASVGISRFVVGSGFSGEASWLESQRAALKLLRLADVTIRYVNVDESTEA